MKIVCVSDAYITPDMMREGVAPFLKADSGERELEMLKPTAVLINTARAHLVDTLALKRSLDKGKPLRFRVN